VLQAETTFFQVLNRIIR